MGIFDEFDFDDENFDPEIYKEYLKNIYESLTGESLTDEELNDMKISDGRSLFIEPLEKDLEGNYVNEYIDDNNMICDVEFEDTDYGIMVKENWRSEENSVEVNRMYAYDHRIISQFEKDRQIMVYENILQEFLDCEDYEEAAIVRDKLKELNS